MSDVTPSGFADTPGPDATPEQDADVRALLALLRDEPLEMPDDVRSRLEAVLAEERRASTGRALGATAALADSSSERSGTTAPVTVLPTGASRRGPSTRAFRIVGGLAAAALVVLGGVVVLRGTGVGGSTSGGAESAASASSSTAAGGTLVTASGTAYAKATLAAQARTLATAARVRSATDATAPANGVPAAPSPATAGGTTFRAFTPDNATVCVRAITDGGTSVALAVDSGSYAGRPAVVVVVPTQGDPTQLDVFVVKPDCAAGTPDIVEFQRIPAS